MKKYTAFILFNCFALVFLSSCNPYKYQIVETNKSITGSYQKFSSAKEALFAGFPEEIAGLNPNNEEKLFADAVIKQKNGEYDAADSLFKLCYNKSDDLSLKFNAKFVMRYNYLLNDKYDEYFEFFKTPGEPDNIAKQRLGYTKYKDFPLNVEFHKGSDTISIFYEGGYIYVPAKIDGDKQIKYFLLDLSSTYSYQINDSCRKTGTIIIHEFPEDKVAANDRTPDKLGVIPKLNIGHTKVSNVRMQIIKEERLQVDYIVGVLGLDFFKNFELELNTQKKIIILKKPIKRLVPEKNLLLLNLPIIKYLALSGLYKYSLIAFSTPVSHYFWNENNPLDSSIIISKNALEQLRYLDVRCDNINFYLNNNKILNYKSQVKYNKNDAFLSIGMQMGSEILSCGVVRFDFYNNYFEISPF